MAKNLEDCIGAVRLNCGDATGASHPALSWQALTHHLNAAASEIAQRTRLLENKVSFNTVVGDSQYDIGLATTTFLDDKSCTWNYIQLEQLGWMEYQNIYQGGVDGAGGLPANGSPMYYSVRRGSLHIYPPPDTAGTNNLTLYFIHDAIQMTTSATQYPFYGTALPSDYRPVFHLEEAAIAGGTARTLRAMGKFREAQEYAGEFERLLMAAEEAAGPLDREEVQVFGDTE